MKIDWKEISKSPGYRSLKKAYIRDVQEDSRSKEELHARFMRVLGYAKHQAHLTGKSISELLTTWEKERDYGWLNFYQDYKFKPRVLRKMCDYKPKNKAGRRDSSKKERWPFNSQRKSRARTAAFRRQQQAKLSL